MYFTGTVTDDDTGEEVDVIGFEFTDKSMLEVLRSTEVAYRRFGKAFGTDYTFNHLKNGWVLGTIFARSVVHTDNGESHLTAKPVVMQVGTGPPFLNMITQSLIPYVIFV
jgi:hypothetical protein